MQLAQGQRSRPVGRCSRGTAAAAQPWTDSQCKRGATIAWLVIVIIILLDLLHIFAGQGGCTTPWSHWEIHRHGNLQQSTISGALLKWSRRVVRAGTSWAG